jgi:hypothetical protein
MTSTAPTNALDAIRLRMSIQFPANRSSIPIAASYERDSRWSVYLHVDQKPYDLDVEARAVTLDTAAQSAYEMLLKQAKILGPYD